MQEIRQGQRGILREIRAKWQVSDVGQLLGMGLFGFLGGEASGGLAGRVVAGEVGRGPSGSVATKPT
jgi:hypothetical protein